MVALGYCETLSQIPDLRLVINGEETIITCIPIRIDPLGVIQAAWTQLRSSYEAGREIEVEVQQVDKDVVLIDAYGLRIKMDLRDLSELEITDARKYFLPE